jgi:hypothetical protein
VSGFSQRLDVIPFYYVNPSELQKELSKHFNFSKSEAELIVKALGGHLGHVQDFLQTMKISNGKLTVAGHFILLFILFIYFPSSLYSVAIE